VSKQQLRPELARELTDLGREMSTRTVLLHQAIADRLGLGPSDHKCLDIAYQAGVGGHVTAGQLAQLTGLTTGAITGVLDRLEKAGFVRRERDPGDRRQVLVRLLPDRLPELTAVFEPIGRTWLELCAGYSEQELHIIRDFLQQRIRITQQETERLRAGAGAPEPAPPESAPEAQAFSAPLGGVTRGALELVHGATNLTLAALRGGDLFRSRCEGQAPKIAARDGKVTVDYELSVRRLLDFRRRAITLELNAAVQWTIAVRWGASGLQGDLRDLPLAGLEITHGASDVSLVLPPPAGVVPVRITGGVSHVRLVRPAGVAMRARVTGGASELTLDSLHLGSVGGEARWATPDFGDATARYEIEITGGASDLVITTDALPDEGTRA
jgi:DNA-binding MarR family transcriptional regulator